jgi:hypothetical protein
MYPGHETNHERPYHKARPEKPHSRTLMRPSSAITVPENRQATRCSVKWESTRNKTPLGRWTSLTCSSDYMSRGPFSGRDIVKVMVNSGIYEWDRTNGDHAILRWEPPADHDSDARTVPVPLHEEVDSV